MSEPEERDLAHEADMRALMRQQLRDNISPEEAEAELADWDAEQEMLDDNHLMGDPDEYDEPYCICGGSHSIEEMDSNQCDCCGKDIA